MNTCFPRSRLTTFWLGLAVLIASGCPGRADVLDHWTTNQVSTNYFGPEFVVYGNGCYVAFGEYSDYGVVLSSEDGMNWTQRADGGPPTYTGLSYSTGLSFDGGRFFALGGFGASAFSANGTNWTMFSHSFAIGRLSGAVFRLNRYVAVGADSPVTGGIITSTNGIDWTQQSTVPLNDIAWGGSFVAIGNDNGVTMTSANTINWTQRTIPGGNKISFLGGRYIVPYNAGTNLFSVNGIDWAAVSTGLTNRLGKILLSHGVYLARAGNYLATSLDSTNWIQYDAPLSGNNLFSPDVASDGVRIVTVGRTSVPFGINRYDGFIYTSDILAAIRMTNTAPPKVVLSGLVGRTYRIEATEQFTSLTNATWSPLVTLQLPANPYLWTDPTATNFQRFYRSVLLP